MKKLPIITISLILLLATFASPATIMAQEAPVYPGSSPAAQPGESPGTGFSSSGTGQEAICRGDRDWSTFISATLSYDDFAEYWKDILYRYSDNICHYTDIDSLLNRVNKAREQIRKAFYSCAPTSTLKKTYYRLEAELFFLRKYIDTSNGNFIAVNPDKLHADLRNYFVLNKSFFTDEEMDQLFEEFKTKYDNRLSTYKNCKDANWTDLVNKWQEFKDNVLILFTDPKSAPAIQAATEDLQKHWDRMANTPLDLGRFFTGDFLNASINGLPPQQGWDQIAAEFAKNSPQGYTFEQLQAAKSIADASYEYSKMEAEFTMQYYTLYKEVSDTFTVETLDRLQALDGVIQSTFPFENQTEQCLKYIANKQC